MLLKHSLGGNCSTSVIATLSPSSQHKQESSLTLRFARSCKSVCNIIVRNKYTSTIPKSVSLPKEQPNKNKNKKEEAPLWRGAVNRSGLE